VPTTLGLAAFSRLVIGGGGLIVVLDVAAEWRQPAWLVHCGLARAYSVSLTKYNELRPAVLLGTLK